MPARLVLGAAGVTLAVAAASAPVQAQPRKSEAVLQAECNRGNSESCGLLAVEYYESMSRDSGTDALHRMDAARALSLGVRACNGDQSLGCMVAGDILLKGYWGQRRNRSAGVQYLDKACRLNLALGCETLGHAYLAGFDVPVDHAKADLYLQKACLLDEEVCKALAGRAPPSPAAAPGGAPAATARPFTLFGLRLGVEQFPAVTTMIERRGGSIADRQVDRLFDRRVKTISGAWPEAEAGFFYIAFDFKSAPEVLTAISVGFRGPDPATLAERAAALTRKYGPSDGKAGTAWHRLVPGAEIVLLTDPSTGKIEERYIAAR